MTKSKPLKGMATATAVACSACATTPILPSQSDCPEGSRQTYDRFRMDEAVTPLLSLADGFDPVVVHEGDFTLIPLNPWGDLPPGRARLLGKLVFGKNRVYGRFTELHLPNGETFPICVELSSSGMRGVPMDAKSTRDRVMIGPDVDFDALPNPYFKY